jgi:hypothetical protein
MSPQHISTVAQLSHLCVPFCEKLNHLLDRLDNRRMMHGSRSFARCMVHEAMHLSGCTGIKSTPVTIMARRFSGYKYSLRLALITILLSSLLFTLGFPGIKRERSPSAKGSPLPSDAKTPPSVPSGSPAPPGSPSEISSRRPCSPVFVQGGSSEKVPMIGLSLSSDEEKVHR